MYEHKVNAAHKMELFVFQNRGMAHTGVVCVCVCVCVFGGMVAQGKGTTYS